MLKEKISQNLNSALKEKRELEVSVLRQLLAAVFNKEKEKRYKLSREKPDLDLEKLGKESPQIKELEKQSAFNDEEIIEVISSEIKKEKEALILFEKGKRGDLVKKATAEIEILEKYLPEQLSEDELKKLTREAIEKVGAKEMRDMGKVMAELMPKIKGKADAGQISKNVKDLLNTAQGK